MWKVYGLPNSPADLAINAFFMCHGVSPGHAYFWMPETNSQTERMYRMLAETIRPSITRIGSMRHLLAAATSIRRYSAKLDKLLS